MVTEDLAENAEYDVEIIIFGTTRPTDNTRTNESLQLGGKVYRDLEFPRSIGLIR